MKDYNIYLRHILDECDFLLQETVHINKEQFLHDELRIRAFSRSMEIIGEAAKNIPQELREKYPHVDFKLAAGLRDVLIHQYFKINIKIVWSVLEDNIPKLHEQIKLILDKGGF
jgi:uncharacterized protein with HEPN domain